ncbi:hypothetical protein [Pseudoalteromonas denitrificans]|jgi:hypothetical protein|uniref:Uncharacterized protein n=1 Tax=Pseudoalteromonas denitrificans DSM 6059 TaxID=1123010 RepID=A0A1I1SUH1_9GAMM|nr:hypothetical protein [Pseudoalteromonas denitrificans]SFD50036.1 hypothetical protein SAMN02745724_04689 [Pseudoalteromonas denitrificans DSM 6059]
MNIQEIAVSNRQKKKIQRDVNSEKVLQLDDNGDVIIHVASYVHFKESMKGNDATPIEAIVGDGVLDFSAEYFVFS